MKKPYLLYGIILILTIICCMGAYTETKRLPWVLVRTVTSSDVPLDGITSGRTYLATDINEKNVFNPDEIWNAGRFIFEVFGKATSDTKVMVYAYALGGPVLPIAELALHQGTAVGRSGGKYVDSIIVTASYWHNDNASSNPAGTVAWWMLDLQGYSLYFQTTFGNGVSKLNIYGKGF